jgi:hypothetical protein
MRQLGTNAILISKGRKNKNNIIVGKRAYQIPDIIAEIEHNSRKFKKERVEQITRMRRNEVRLRH